MGGSLSVEEKVYRSAKAADVVQLQGILQALQRQGADLKKYLEFEDTAGQTPIIVAAVRGNSACVELLLKHGANPHHFTRRPEGTTALHESVQRGHAVAVNMLLQYGANPFIENGRGLTSVDLAITRGDVQLVRSLELRSHYTGTLLLKVTKFMGFGTEWKSRWAVVMPRYTFPFNSRPEDRVARSLLVMYKGSDQVVPVCKVWLDGAVARSVVGSKGAGLLQCALTLHRNHALASGAHMTGDAVAGYTLHLRPQDGTSASNHALRRFMEIVNGTRRSEQPQDQPSPSTSQPPPAPVRPPQPSAAPAGFVSHHPTESDEDVARRLQQQYDAEMEEYARENPEAARAARKVSQVEASANPAVARVQHSPASSSSFHSIPSAPMYPTINQAGTNAHLMDALPATRAHLPSQMPQGGSNGLAGVSGSYEWCSTNLRAAPAPPPSAAVPQLTPEQANPPLGTAGSSALSATDADEAGMCVICLAEPATAGFLHGESVHKCCCRSCAQDLKKARVPTCPMCREPIEHVILNFY